MLTWPRQIPIDGEPAEVVEIVRAYGDWLAASSVPKLFVNAEPGAILIGAHVDQGTVSAARDIFVRNGAASVAEATWKD